MILYIVSVSLLLGMIACTNKAREPRCFHNQGKGNFFIMDQDMRAYVQTYYKDYDNMRIIEVMSESTPGPALFLYRNFTTDEKYIMFKDGSCMILPMAGENIHCMPPDAEFRHSIRLEESQGSGPYRQLESWDFQSNGEFDGRVVDRAGHPYVFRKQDSMVTYWFHNVEDRLEADDFLFFDVDLSACVAVQQ